MRRARIALCAFLFLVLSACAPTPPIESAPVVSSPTLRADNYRQALTRGEPVFRIDPAHSRVVALVYRGGPLQRFGHNHTVSSTDIRGYVALPSVVAAAADLYIPLSTFQVDESADRAAAAFDTQPSASDIAGTTENMNKVLQPERYPFLVLRLDGMTGVAAQPIANASLTLHGVTRTFPLTLELAHSDNTLRAHGTFSLRQTDFGITPFALFGGALQVQDRIDIRFDVAARRTDIIDD